MSIVKFTSGDRITLDPLPMVATYVGIKKVRDTAQNYADGDTILLQERDVHFIRVDGGARDTTISVDDLNQFRLM